MLSIELPTTAGKLGALFGAEILGDPSAPIATLAPLEKAGLGTLTFLAHPKFADGLEKAKGAVVFASAELARTDLPITFLVVPDPQSSFASIARGFRPVFPWSGISPQARISATARIHPSASVAPFAFVGDGVEIGAGTVVYPDAYISSGVQIGEQCEIHPRVMIYDRVRLGNRVKVFAGTVIGSEGFGFFRKGKEGPYTDMPQIGNVVIEEDVRIGSNCTIDRGTLRDTRVGRGTKIDNLVQIGHNVEVGENCILCAGAAIGGSAVLENDVIMGGQAGVAHGIRVGSGAVMGGQCGALTNVAGNDTYSFTPHTSTRDFARILRYFRRLPELAARLKRLEKQREGSNG